MNDARDLVARLDGPAALARLDERTRRELATSLAATERAAGARWNGEQLVPLEPPPAVQFARMMGFETDCPELWEAVRKAFGRDA